MSELAFFPLADRVLLKREAAEKVTKGGIHIPDSAQDKPQVATVVRLGDGKLPDGGDYTFSVAVGDRVIVTKYGGTEITLDDKQPEETTFVVMREADIFGVVREVDAT